jgi:hypothetical protein
VEGGISQPQENDRRNRLLEVDERRQYREGHSQYGE